MLKQDLRSLYKQKRLTLSDDEVSFFSEEMLNQFVDFFKPKNGQKIHVFLTIKKLKEVETQFFIRYFFENGIRIFVPKVQNKKMLTVELLPDTEFVLDKWGILEPISDQIYSENNFDFVLTPLLYCDINGNRVGYGKGFYDDFFKNSLPNTIKIGLNYFKPNEVIQDAWSGDIPLDYLVLPTEVLSFEKRTLKSTK